MFTTPEAAQGLTGRDNITFSHIYAAQTIIESYVGKQEADIVDADDLAILEKATIFQAAYLVQNGTAVYDQVAVQQLSGAQSVVSFKSGDFTAPWIAPLAVIACKHLSWRKSRSVKTGKHDDFPRAVLADWRRY